MDRQTMTGAFAELGAATLGECGALAMPPRVKAGLAGSDAGGARVPGALHRR